MSESYNTAGQSETEALGAALARRLRPGDVVAMFGGLGAGKTALARGILRGLGYSQPVASPTFAIVNEYRSGALEAAHFDMYRVANEQALCSTGYYDYLDGRFVLLIEWSEHIKWALDADAIRVTIAPGGGPDGRLIEIKGMRA